MNNNKFKESAEGRGGGEVGNTKDCDMNKNVCEREICDIEDGFHCFENNHFYLRVDIDTGQSQSGCERQTDAFVLDTVSEITPVPNYYVNNGTVADKFMPAI